MKNKNNFVSLSIIVVSILSLVILIPFNSDGIVAYEWIGKYIGISAIVLILSIISQVFSKEEKLNKKIGVIGQVTPITITISSLLLLLAQYEIKFGNDQWMQMFTIDCIFAVAFIILSFVLILGKGEIYFHKMNKIITIVSYILMVLTIIYSIIEINSLENMLNEGTKIDVLKMASYIIGIVLAIAYIISYLLVKNVIVNEEIMEIDEEQYLLHKKDYLLNMHDFSIEELRKLGYNLPKEKEIQILEVEKPVEVEKIVEVEKPVEVEKIIEIEKVVEVEKPVEVEKLVEIEKIVEVEKPVEVEKIVEIEKIVEKIVEVEKPVEVEKIVEKIVEVEKPVIVYMEKPRVPRKPKEKKVIEPSVAKLAEYITTHFHDANIVYGKNEDNYKVYRNKKLMCIVQSSTNDYKIIFQRKPISVAKLLIKYPNVIVKANSPHGEQWFRVVNKGDVSEEDLKTIIKFSHKYLVDAEAKELAKKEKAKAKIKAKKEAERAKIKAKKDAIKAKEKAKKEAEKAKLKAKEEAAKAREKARLEAQKAKEAEKARLKAEKEKEKQAAKEAKLAEQASLKEQSKTKVQKEVEKEQAKIDAQKAKWEEQKIADKEKEVLEIKKAVEKEQAKINAQKEKWEEQK